MTKSKQKTPVKKLVAAKAKVNAKARKHTKKILVPHRGNDYRPHLIRPYGIIAVLVVALVAQVVYGFTITGNLQILGKVYDVKTEELLIKTNEKRVENGLSELVSNDLLAKAADLKARDMIASDYWAHDSPEGVTPWKWLDDVGYKYTAAGENLAKNYPNASLTVDAWMASEGHRKNILSDKYSEVGFAVIDGEIEGRAATLVVALYGQPRGELPSTAGQVLVEEPFYNSPVGAAIPAGYFASIFQSMSPVTIISLGVLAVVALVGAVAHHYRKKLPKSWQNSWKKHHGAYTFFGMIIIGIIVIIATGGGGL